MEDPKAMNDYKETPSGHSRAVTQMNSYKLQQHEQNLCMIKPEKSHHGKGGGHTIPGLAVEQLTIVKCWKMVCQFSFRV